MQRTENKNLSQTCKNLRECFIHILYSSFGFVYEYKNMEKYLDPNLFYMKLYFLVEFLTTQRFLFPVSTIDIQLWKGILKTNAKEKTI